MPEGFTPAPTTTITAQPPFTTGPHVLPSFDVLELLPPRAADRLRALRQRAADAHAVVPLFEKIREASSEKVAAENVLKRLTDPAGSGGFNLPLSDRRVVEAAKRVEKLTDDFRRVQELQSVRAAAFQTAAQAKVACEDYLRNGKPGGTTLEDCETPEPKLHKNETLLEAIERLRRRCRELKADARRIQSAPYPSTHAKAKMRAEIEALAQRGAVDVGLAVNHDGQIGWPTQIFRAQVFNNKEPLFVSTEVPDTVALFAWLHRDALIKRLEAEIDTKADDKNALSYEERQRVEAKVLGDILSAERDEAALVWQAQEQNLPVEHRGDCSPLAILQCRLVTTPRAAPAGTSVEHAYEII